MVGSVPCGRNALPNVRDVSLWCCWVRVRFSRAAGSLLGCAGGLGWDADREGAWLDLGEQGGGFADDVAVELVVLLSVDDDPHRFSGALVDLVILLGASGDEP